MKLQTSDYEELALILNLLVNPQNVFSAKIEWNEQNQRFESTNDQTADKYFLSHPITLITIIQDFQQYIHDLSIEKQIPCRAAHCKCQYTSLKLQYLGLFEALTKALKNKKPELTLIDFEDMIAKEPPKSRLEPLYLEGIDKLLSLELRSLYQKHLSTQIPPNSIFGDHRLSDCVQGNHKSKETIVWESKSQFSFEDPYHGQRNLPRYIVKSHTCQYCDTKVFSTWKSILNPPTKLFYQLTSDYVQLTLQFFPSQWEALEIILKDSFPAGQARVIAKILSNVPLSSTERSIKQHLKQKLLKLKLIMQLWLDFEVLF